MEVRRLKRELGQATACPFWGAYKDTPQAAQGFARIAEKGEFSSEYLVGIFSAARCWQSRILVQSGVVLEGPWEPEKPGFFGIFFSKIQLDHLLNCSLPTAREEAFCAASKNILDRQKVKS